MDIGASNKPGTGMIARLYCAGGTFSDGAVRDHVAADMASSNDRSVGNYLTLSAEWAKHFGCGNCGEQSALAFSYLREHSFAPLDWMRIGNFKHAFVIIGRKSDSDPSDYNTWGNEAAVCDPWAGRAEPRIYIGVWNWKPVLLYRQE
jgi:hypothetical protein